jgi:glyoxylate reductase
MPPRVLIAAELKTLLPDPPLPGYEIIWLSTQDPTPTGDFVALVPLLSRAIGPEELDGLPDLKVLAQCAVGYDNIDLQAAEARGIPVTNTPEVLTESTADLAWALILAVARRMKEGQEMLATDSWTGWSPTQLLGLELNDAALGIVGAGRIGQAVARRGVGFGMRIFYSDVQAQPQLEESYAAEWRSLHQLLEESDVVSLHVPSNAETRGLFDYDTFSQMKPGSLFINTARGDLVDEPGLLRALDEGILGGAGLDVFSREPQVPRELVDHPRVVALPHIGSATVVTRRAMAELALKNAAAVLAGRTPLTPVSPPAG